MRAMVQLLETFPRIDVVMAVNEQAALGAMAALEEKGVYSIWSQGNALKWNDSSLKLESTVNAE